MAQALSEPESARLRDQLVKDGPEAVSERTGLSVVTLLRAAAGLQLHNATCVVVQRALEVDHAAS